MKRADELVERSLPILDPLPRTTQVGRSRIDPRLSAAASRVVSRPVEIRCLDRHDWERLRGALRGYYEDERNLVGLALRGKAHVYGRWCDRLADFPGRVAGPLESFALKVVVHEATHLKRPSWSEAHVECSALQHVDEMARVLGATPEAAQRLARIEWTLNYPYNPPRYRSAACRPGGAFDETPGDGVWP